MPISFIIIIIIVGGMSLSRAFYLAVPIVLDLNSPPGHVYAPMFSEWRSSSTGRVLMCLIVWWVSNKALVDMKARSSWVLPTIPQTTGDFWLFRSPST